jgi:site-specific DNA-cytosine methylase
VAAFAWFEPANLSGVTFMVTRMLTMADFFCGAGGSSLGAHQAGIEVKLAVNHWQPALSVHAAAMRMYGQDTVHLCENISSIDVEKVPPHQVLWTSPECISHSPAFRLGSWDPERIAQSRSTIFKVLEFVDFYTNAGCPPEALVVENVSEFAAWNGFRRVLDWLGSLGYRHRVLHVNSALASVGGPAAPQLRDRMYLVAWRAELPEPDFDYWLSPPAVCSDCGPVNAVQRYRKPVHEWIYRGAPGVSRGAYRFQYDMCCPICDQVLVPAMPSAVDCLDLSLPMAPVLRRTRPRAEATVTRVRAGILKATREGSVLPDGRHGFIMRNNGSSGTGAEHCTVLSEPFRTMTTDAHQSLVTFTPGKNALRSARTRFLGVAEVGLAMGFPADYPIAGGESSERAMLGNAVTPAVARDLLAAVSESITGTPHALREAPLTQSTPVLSVSAA